MGGVGGGREWVGGRAPVGWRAVGRRLVAAGGAPSAGPPFAPPRSITLATTTVETPCRREELLRALHSGVTLVVDRYAYSGVAFTAAKGLPGRGRAWCQAPDAGLPAPDAVFFLSLSAEAAEARGGYGEERYEKADFQVRLGGEVGGLQEGEEGAQHPSLPCTCLSVCPCPPS